VNHQGADIPDIELVIQFGVPASLSIFNQRAGRAGRSAHVKAQAVLLVEKSMFKRKKKKRPGGKHTMKPDDSSSESDVESSLSGSDSEPKEIPETIVALSDDGKEWGKKVEESLRGYITTSGCRTAFGDKYFDNPPRRHNTEQLSTIDAHCDECDNCLAHHQARSITTIIQP
jgi:superfamily II DNA helicase RecQ